MYTYALYLQTVFYQSLVTIPFLSFQRLSGLLLAIIWTWLQLLQFDTSNQTVGSSPEEDAKNKPYRPIPSKRITIEQTLALRWALIPMTLVLSLVAQGTKGLEKSLTDSVSGSVGAGIGIIICTLTHNELGGHKYWILKNGIMGFIYGFFDWGATCVAGKRLLLFFS